MQDDIFYRILGADRRLIGPFINCIPKGEYGIDGRKSRAYFQSRRNGVFLEIYTGRSKYIREQLLKRDSRFFSRKLPKNSKILHVIANDEVETGGYSVSDKRLIDLIKGVERAANTYVLVVSSQPTIGQYANIAGGLVELLGL